MNINTPRHKALILLADHPDRFARQGAVVASWRTYRGRRLGPYYRLAWRENRRQRSIYLGPGGPLVDEARRRLHQAQTARRVSEANPLVTRRVSEASPLLPPATNTTL